MIINVTGAGHALLFDGAGGPPVGLFSRLRYEREISIIEAGSVIVIYTDGISEAENAHDEQFGMDRLTSIVCAQRANSAAGIHSNIRTALKEFVGEAPVHDDSTLIVLKFS